MIKYLLVAVLVLQVVAATPASVGPIEQDPIPSWASSSDVCVAKRSCDHCSDSQYCKYTEAGKPQCCSAPDASVGPITENPIPSWASKSDSCAQIRSCDYCSKSNVQYCKYSDKGVPACCKRASSQSAVASVLPDEDVAVAAVLPEEGESGVAKVLPIESESGVAKVLPVEEETGVARALPIEEETGVARALPIQEETGVARTLPIAENPIPAWASKSDVCARKKSCDYCDSTSQYCKYTNKGVPQCCQKAEQVLTASVVPIEENPIPSWASESDVCLVIKSCDHCNNKSKQYCKYSEQGTPSCCTRMF